MCLLLAGVVEDAVEDRLGWLALSKVGWGVVSRVFVDDSQRIENIL